MFSIQELENYLKSSEADFQILSHDQPIISIEDARKQFDVECAAPVLVVQTDRGFMILIVSAKRGRLNFHELGKSLGFEKIRLADKEKAEQETGYRIGSMPLIGVELPCIFDSELMKLEYIYGGSGDEFHTLRIVPRDVQRLNHVIMRIHSL